MKVKPPTPTDLGLIQDPTGFWYVAHPENPLAFYQNQFYQNEKPDYLHKAALEWPYWQMVYQWRLDLLAPQGKLLDVGAGGGFFLKAARMLNWEVYGIEPSPMACNYAREEHGIELIQSDVLAVNWEKRFDVIHCAFVLEHLADPKKVLQKLACWLKPGGRLWVDVPNEWNPLQKILAHEQTHPWWFVPSHHLNYFNRTSLCNLVQQCGFKVQDCFSSFPMEAFVMGGLDYLQHPNQGAEAHQARMRFETKLLAHDPELFGELFRRLADLDLGRSINVMGRKP